MRCSDPYDYKSICGVHVMMTPVYSCPSKDNSISSISLTYFKARNENIHQEEGQQKVERHGGNHPHHLSKAQLLWMRRVRGRLRELRKIHSGTSMMRTRLQTCVVCGTILRF